MVADKEIACFCLSTGTECDIITLYFEKMRPLY